MSNRPSDHSESQHRNRTLLALGLGVSAILVVFAMSEATYRLMIALGLGNDAASLFSSLLEASTAIVGAVFVAYQLGQANEDSARARDIEEASFLLELNKTFIENADMVQVESDLENSWLGKLERAELVTDENRQNFINYLVYLEGIAPFILKGILRFETIDDLMAYRFYLAVNNPELQEDQLKEFPEYYRGCFKLYSKWTSYRREHGFEILNEEHSLDRWSQFERYAYERYDGLLAQIRKPEPGEYADVAELIYGTDPYIYPQAFGSVELARQALPPVMAREEGPFSHNNILVALDANDQVMGILVYLDDQSVAHHYCREDFADLADQLPPTFETVSTEYFDSLVTSNVAAGTRLAIACVSVAESARGHGVASSLLNHVLALYPHRDAELDCLASNNGAILLYRRKGFVQTSSGPGFSATRRKPKVVTMLRRTRTVLPSR